jgi:hypothetical protein
MPEDRFTIEILEDGRVKLTTDQVSPANHMNADEFFKVLAKELGGAVETQRRKEGHTHQHDRQHQH